MPAQTDVVDLLTAQHERIRELFDAVENADDYTRAERFAELRRLLAVHETAEELVVHPRAQDTEGGAIVVQERLQEERWAKTLLHALDQMSPDDPEFATKLSYLRDTVLTHAENEEREEFPLLRAHTDEKTLAQMASAVRAAEALAPTHPHPGVESFEANLLAGPLASLVDRTRDAVRAVLGKP